MFLTPASSCSTQLQADEIRTFAGNKNTPSWVFVTIEVWSRLWPSTVTGRRSYRNTHALSPVLVESDQSVRPIVRDAVNDGPKLIAELLLIVALQLIAHVEDLGRRRCAAELSGGTGCSSSRSL